MKNLISKLQKVLGLLIWFEHVPTADKALVVRCAGQVLIEHALVIANVLEAYISYIIRISEIAISVVCVISPAIPELEAKAKEMEGEAGKLVDGVMNSDSGKQLEYSIKLVRPQNQQVDKILVGDDIA